MILRPEHEKVLPYYDRVRETISNFDNLVVDLLAKGATLVIAILIAPGSFLKFDLGQPGVSTLAAKVMFYASVAAVLAAGYVILAVSLYADLLKRSVKVADELEDRLFSQTPEVCLTKALEKNPLAGGRGGRWLYLALAGLLYAGAAFMSYEYFELVKRSFCGTITLIVLYVLLALLIGAGVLWMRAR